LWLGARGPSRPRLFCCLQVVAATSISKGNGSRPCRVLVSARRRRGRDTLSLMVATTTMVHVRVNEKVKARAEKALRAMGLTASDAARVLLTRVAAERALPFEVKVPNAKTRAASSGPSPSATSWPTSMRTIERTKALRRDRKKVGSGVDGRRARGPLPASNHDHQLTGEWADHWECHVRPDLLLIYRKPDPETLQFVRLGSHGELFG